MPRAQLDEQRVDRAHLNPSSAAGVADLGGGDVVLPIGADEGQRAEPLDDDLHRLRAVEPLQKFLEHHARGHHGVRATAERVAQDLDLRHIGCAITAQGQGPDAGVDQQHHERLRSDL